jgi:hypothetical protein
MRYVTRTSALEFEDFNSAKSRLIERADKFGEISYKVCFSVCVVGCGVISFLLLMVPELVICLFCFCRLAKLLQCLVKILYLMVVPFWFMVFPELSLKFLNWLHIIKNASGSSALVFFSLSV